VAKRVRRQRRKPKKLVGEEGIAHIVSSFNNTIITITDTNGNAVSWSSGGRIGFTGTKKSTPYAAQMAAKEAADVAMEAGMKLVEARTKGPGSGKEAALRALGATGLKVTRTKDITPIPFGGCRGKKRRRV